MKRDPSLHIKRSDLLKILRELFPTNAIKWDYNEMVDSIIQKAKTYSATNRGILLSQDKVEKKANFIVKSSRKDAYTLSKVLLMVRRKLGHKGLRLITQESKEWSLVKSITELANNFCTEFELGKTEGYTQFLLVGANKMNKFGLTKYAGMYEGICEAYSAIKEIGEDPWPSDTDRLQRYYRAKVGYKTGLVNSYKDMPEKYVYFVRATRQVKSLQVPIEVYIDAQFSMMEFRHALPDPIQLVGPKAQERLNKYLFENKIKV